VRVTAIHRREMGSRWIVPRAVKTREASERLISLRQPLLGQRHAQRPPLVDGRLRLAGHDPTVESCAVDEPTRGTKVVKHIDRAAEVTVSLYFQHKLPPGKDLVPGLEQDAVGFIGVNSEVPEPVPGKG
jgi:hypothetical protein